MPATAVSRNERRPLTLNFATVKGGRDGENYHTVVDEPGTAGQARPAYVLRLRGDD